MQSIFVLEGFYDYLRGKGAGIQTKGEDFHVDSKSNLYRISGMK